MKVGTKSVFGGGHAWFLHGFVVALSWTRLFGFPWDPRLWFAFFLHDLGYLGRDTLESPADADHVIRGARIMGWLFGSRWESECLRHSRAWCRKTGAPVSRLCLADKLAFAITPAWLYLPMTRWTGELDEYVSRSRERQVGDRTFTEEERRLIVSGDEKEWLRGMQSHTRRWVERHHSEFVDRLEPTETRCRLAGPAYNEDK